MRARHPSARPAQRLVRGDGPAIGKETEASIALLQLDGDWYESTMVCLQNLFPLVVEDGLVIIDDYGTWDGCTKAVHAYLSEHDGPEAVRYSPDGVAYLRKVVTER